MEPEIQRRLQPGILRQPGRTVSGVLQRVHRGRSRKTVASVHRRTDHPVTGQEVRPEHYVRHRTLFLRTAEDLAKQGSGEAGQEIQDAAEQSD